VRNTIFDSWDKIKPSETTHKRILANISARTQHTKAKKRLNGKTFGSFAACLFMVLSLAIAIPFFLRNSEGEFPDIIIYHVPRYDADEILYENDTINGFEILFDDDSNNEFILPGIDLYLPGGTPIAPTHPITLPPIADALTLPEAVADPFFGRFIPGNIPPGFTFDLAWRFYYEDGDSLIAFWQDGANTIRWQISTPTDCDRERIVSVNNREKFDLGLYTVPWADSVPGELMKYVMNPVFKADELCLEIVQARTVQGRGRGQEGSLNFSVLFDAAVVNISASGVSPEHVWEMVATSRRYVPLNLRGGLGAEMEAAV